MNRRLLIVTVIALGICVGALVAAEGPHYYRTVVVLAMPGGGGGE